MTYFIIGAVVLGLLIYLGAKGNADTKNVEKYGGLRNKYNVLIGNIMSRNPYYQIFEKNSNNIVLSCTGMTFRLIELDKKLQVVWIWERNRFGLKIYKKTWHFDENMDQIEMYKQIDAHLEIQNLVDDGMTDPQAKDFYLITKAASKEERERLVNDFKNKYPNVLENLMGK